MSRHLLLPALAAAALAAGSGHAAPATADHPVGDSPRACFFARNVSSWREAGDQTVYLRVGVSDLYRVQLLSSCPDLRFAEAIGLKTQGGSDTICSGLDIEITVPSSVTHTVPQRCMATSLHKLSPDEAKTLPKGQRP